MLALRNTKTLEVTQVPTPPRQADEALVRVRLAGICNTDIELTRGYMGFQGILGHEFVGEVAEASRHELVGRRVVGEINIACGVCPTCQHDLGRHCPYRSVLGILSKDGCLAEYVTLPLGNLHVVPDDVEDERAVFVEPLAAAFEILEQVHIAPQNKVLIVGDGKIGLLVAMVMRHTGCDLTLVGRHGRKLALVERLGVRVALEADGVEGDGYDVVVDATGSAAGLKSALERVRPRGTLVLKSTLASPVEIDTNKLVVDEIRLVGSRCGPFAPAIRALAERRIDPTPLIEARFALTDAVAAMQRAASDDALKVLVYPLASA